MSIGKKLKTLRVKTRKTLKEQGAMLGVSLNSVYRWEHGLASPRKSMLKKIADIYEVPLEWLLQESEMDEPIRQTGDVVYLEHNTEYQLLRFFRKLSENDQYKVLGYIERLYIENTDKQRRSGSKVAAASEG